MLRWICQKGFVVYRIKATQNVQSRTLIFPFVFKQTLKYYIV